MNFPSRNSISTVATVPCNVKSYSISLIVTSYHALSFFLIAPLYIQGVIPETCRSLMSIIFSKINFHPFSTFLPSNKVESYKLCDWRCNLKFFTYIASATRTLHARQTFALLSSRKLPRYLKALQVKDFLFWKNNVIPAAVLVDCSHSLGSTFHITVVIAARNKLYFIIKDESDFSE